MAIVNHEQTSQLEFGFGDIKVSPGTLDTDDVIGVVVFQNQKARPIGDHEDHVPNLKLDINETPVRMTFEKIESIDVVIWALQETKQMMIKKLNGDGQPEKTHRDHLRESGYPEHLLDRMSDEECEGECEAVGIV